MAVDRFGVAPEELLQLLLATAIVFLVVVVFAGLAALLWIAVRMLRRDSRGQ
jgi:threonine/homoserine/homoserine lactone efflux protein